MADNTGKQVKVHYVGTLDDGQKFDSSVDRGEPLEFVCMDGQMIPGFDAAVKEMEVGETRKVHIPCEQAYGPRNEDAVQKVPTEHVPDADKLPIGETVFFRGPGGHPFPAKIISVDTDFVTFDMTHEMAGKDLNFEITLLEIA